MLLLLLCIITKALQVWCGLSEIKSESIYYGLQLENEVGLK